MCFDLYIHYKELEEYRLLSNEESKRLLELQQVWIEACETLLPNAIINGSLKNRLPNNIHLTFPGFDNERLLYQLDEVGIMAAAGSACSASHEESSSVLKAIGLDGTLSRSSLRFTMGRTTTRQEIEQVIATLQKLTQPGSLPA